MYPPPPPRNLFNKKEEITPINGQNCKVRVSKELQNMYELEKIKMQLVGLPAPTFDEWFALRQAGIINGEGYKKSIKKRSWF
jgi:hypothetical protein